MRWGLLALVLMFGCGDDDGTNPDGGMDAGTDAGEADAGTDAPDPDAGGDDAGGDDAGADAGDPDAGPAGSCGWSETNGSFECFASDPAPDTVVCTGDECCTPTPCSPDDDQVCCNMVTGELRVIGYTGGTCEETTDPCED